MKVLLVRPSWEYPFTKEEATYNRVFLPLELATSASLLRNHGHDVSILDGHALNLTPEKEAERSKGFDKVFISSSSYDRWQCPNVNILPFLETVKAIRTVNKSVYVLGYHGTVRPYEISKSTSCHVVIRGEPEFTILEICSNKPYSEILGLSYRENGNFLNNPDRPLFDLDDLPVPAFDLFDMSRYYYEPLGNNFAVLEASRGCPYSCNFCELTMFQGKYRKKSSENFIREIEEVVLNNNVKNAYFMDLEFTLNKKLVNDVCDYLIEKDYDFSWCCQTRADSVNLELLQKMKKAKCKIIHYGVESGSNTILVSTNKKIARYKIEEGVEMAKKAGIEVLCFFLMGLPNETEKNIRKTIKFAKKLSPDIASFHIVLPYLGSKIYSSEKNPNEADDIKKGLFPVDFERKIPLPKLQKLLKMALIQYYLNPAFIFKHFKNIMAGSPVKLFLLFLRRIRDL